MAKTSGNRWFSEFGSAKCLNILESEYYRAPNISNCKGCFLVRRGMASHPFILVCLEFQNHLIRNYPIQFCDGFYSLVERRPIFRGLDELIEYHSGKSENQNDSTDLDLSEYRPITTGIPPPIDCCAATRNADTFFVAELEALRRD